ncbi:MAG: hypothetical protein QOG60_103 [Frankiaceae bacterium]|nr:hypothetical protein [Frankiaceae bacterium]
MSEPALDPVPVDRLLAGALQADPSGPFLTFYDDATGERIELSLTSLQNWVAKTANLFVDEFDLEAGDVVTVALPPHWQGVAIVLGVALAGGTVGPAGRVAVFAEGDAPPDAEDLVGLGLRPMGGGLRTPQPGVLDFAREVPGHGDHFAAVAPADLEVGVPLADRLLTTSLDPLVSVLAGRGSLVLCRNADPAKLADRAATERVTATWGVDVPGLPRRG